MFAKTKGIAIVAGVLLCTLSLMGSRANMPRQPRMSVELPGDGTSPEVAVRVEAFVVEVNLPALAALDVSPIGQEPHPVAVADLLECLDAGQARVVGGAGAASQPQMRTAANARMTETTYLKRERGAPAVVSYDSYHSARSLSVGIGPVSNTAVSVQFSYTQSRLTPKAQMPEAPPQTENWEWAGSTILEPGEPQIVAAGQNTETAVFLLLTAHIRNE